VVDADLAALSQAGFNVVHLYIWDADYMSTINEPSGFVGAGGEPSQSTNNQWQHLNDFVTLAENHGLYVILDFVSGWQRSQMGTSSDDTSTLNSSVVGPYSTWIGKFISYLCGSPNNHQNMLGWNDYWTLVPTTGATALTNPPPGGQTFSKYSYVFAKLYYAIDQISRQYSPSPGVLGLIGTAPLGFGIPSDPGATVLRGPGYSFTWSGVQQNAQTMHSLLTALYGYSKDPDFYTIQGYHPNSWDFYSGLNSLINDSDNGFTIPHNKIFVNEWATSSALGPSATGVPYVSSTTDVDEYNAYPSSGDSQTPVMTEQAHASWVQNTLCALSQAGVQKAAYWAMYDPYTVFSASPYSYVGQGLAWWGYWGLAYEESGNGNKQAWSVLQQYYQYNTLTWPPGGTVYNASPLLSLTPLTHYYTVNQPIRVNWTASDISAIAIPGASTTLGCDMLTRQSLSSNSVEAASCAWTDAPYATTTGNHTITATATGTNGSPNNQTTATATVLIGVGPNLNAATNADYGYTISAAGWMILWGEGFANESVNAIQCIRNGYSDVWLSGASDLPWQSNTQINVNLQNLLAPGVWTLKEWNGYSSNSSSDYQVTITQ
jgi:hypothetical protein